MSLCGCFVTIVIIVTSELLPLGSSVENSMCFDVSNKRICYFQPQEDLTDRVKQWENASNICREDGATLPIIETHEAQKTFEQYLRNIGLNNNKIWLGGRQVSKKEWQWSNKKIFYQSDSTMEGIYNNWSDRNNRANGDCLFATSSDHRWEASRCDDKERFICQRVAVQTQTRRQEKTSTSGNLALIVGLSIGITSLAAIIILIVIFAYRRRKVRTASVTRSISENEEQYQNLNRITAYENVTDNYTDLTTESN